MMVEVHTRTVRIALSFAAIIGLQACADRTTEPGAASPLPRASASMTRLECRADVRGKSVACARPRNGANTDVLVLGGQGTYIQLIADSVFYNGEESSAFKAYLTLQNLTAQVLGNDGGEGGAAGVDVFLNSGPVGDAGIVTLNADGLGSFTEGGSQQYMHYGEVLDAFGGTSGSKLWCFTVPPSVRYFTFTVLVSAPVVAMDLPLRWAVERGFPHFSNLFVYGVDRRNVFAFGEQGVGLETGYTFTVDRFDGAAWHTINTNFPFEPHAAWGSSPSNLWVVGEGGNAAHYDGVSWQTEGLPRSSTITAIWGSGPNDIYAVGGCSILHYDGESWTAVDFGGNNFVGVAGTSNDVYVVGTSSETSESVVLRFNGDTWNPVELPSETYIQLQTVYAKGSEVWAGGAGGSIHMLDGTWSVSVGSRDFAQIHGTDANNVWAVGLTLSGDSHFATTLHWDVDTQCWKPVTMPITSFFQSVWTSDQDNVWLVGQGISFGIGIDIGGVPDVGGTAGVPWHWDGSAWTAVGSRPNVFVTGDHGPQGFNATFAAGPSEVWAVGTSGQVLRDSVGSGWRQVGPLEMNREWRAVWGSAVNDIWVVGDSGQIRHWNGTAFTTSTTPGDASGATLRTVFGFGTNDVYAAGDANGGAFMLHYNGTSWSTVSLDVPLSQINSIWGSSANDIWAVGVGGWTVHYYDGNWNYDQYIGCGELFAVHGSTDHPERPVAVGANGLILRRDDGVWLTSSSGTNAALFALYTDGPEGNTIAVGARGTMLRFTDSGWMPVATGVSPDIRGLWMANLGNMYIVGPDGFIAHGSH